MKLKHLFFAMLALTGLAFGCKQDEDLGIAKISVSEKELSFGKEATSQTITLNATRDWEVVNKATWVSVSPENGKGSTSDQQVTVTVLSNSGAPRTATLTFTIGLAKTKVTVSQFGDGDPEGTKGNPYNVADALAYINALAADQETETVVYVKGKISQIEEVDISRFYNATYDISDDGATTTQLKVYRGKGLGNADIKSNDQIKVGDEVIVCGTVVNFKGNTPEFAQGNYIYSLNGEVKEVVQPEPGTVEAKGTGTLDDPFNVTAAVAKAVETGTTATTQEYYIKGTVTGSVDIDLSWGNATFNITDGGSNFKVYHAFSFNGDKFTTTDAIKDGDEVVILAKIVNYKGNTPETDGGKLISLNGKTEGGEVTPPTPAVAYKFKKVTSVTPGKQYLLVGVKDGKTYIATPIQSSKTYGYLAGKEVTVKDDVIAEEGTYAVTIAAVSGGYTITQSDGRFFGSAGASETHKTVQIVTDEDKKVWTITPDAGGSFKMVNVHSGRWMQHGESTFVSFGMYLETVGTLPFLYENTGEETTIGDDTPGGGETGGGDEGEYASNITWTNVTNAYNDGVATVNGVSGVKVYKLGTSKAAGSATVVIPAGTKKIGFYGVSWKGKPATLDIQVGGASVYKQDLATNDGAANNSPYTITVSETDHYAYDLGTALTEDVTATVTTSGENTRIILFGIKAE